ncbi:MAG: hypothetical protein ACOX41_03225 [Anaerovoracaceae bacterium]|jgi:hypothetical protein
MRHEDRSDNNRELPAYACGWSEVDENNFLDLADDSDGSKDPSDSPGSCDV